MASAEIRVEVVIATGPKRLARRELALPVGATAADALRASGLAEGLTGDAPGALQLGRWGQVCAPETVLKDRDRVELTRPLQVDPKEARRLRHRRDGPTRPPRR